MTPNYGYWFWIGLGMWLTAVIMAVAMYDRLPALDLKQWLTANMLYRFGGMLMWFALTVILCRRFTASLISLLR